MPDASAPASFSAALRAGRGAGGRHVDHRAPFFTASFFLGGGEAEKNGVGHPNYPQKTTSILRHSGKHCSPELPLDSLGFVSHIRKIGFGLLAACDSGLPRNCPETFLLATEIAQEGRGCHPWEAAKNM